MDAARTVDSLIGHVVRPILRKESKESLSAVSERLTLSSSAFDDGDFIPEKYSADGGNVSPPLSWGKAPEGARQWLLICEDPDAPRERPFVHWVITLPEYIEGLQEGASRGDLPQGAREATNDMGEIGYFGPRPPSDHGAHRYYFQLFALDAYLDLGDEANRDAIIKALSGHNIGCAELVGTYESKSSR